MRELLIELFSEEIPARMQASAAAQLKQKVLEALTENNLSHHSAECFYTPRRLCVVIYGLPEKAADKKIERRGPRIDAPEQAIEGFLKSVHLIKNDLKVEETEKGSFYIAEYEVRGESTANIVASFMPDIITGFNWQKSMRWGNGQLWWVRPLHKILCILSVDNKTDIINFQVDGIQSSNVTLGHRFMSSKEIEVTNFAQYKQALYDNYVILDPEERSHLIQVKSRELCAAHNVDFVYDKGLLDEIVGLVEWVVPLIGVVEERFQNLPPEVLKTSMRTHQKFFSVRNAENNKITHFITVANIITKDEGKSILNGNQRVLAARLSDAEYFWDIDTKKSLESHLNDLRKVTYHAKLGNQAERIGRVAALAKQIAMKLGANVEKVEKAAYLSKCDLLTEMVGEFPELQGTMGRYYATMEGIDAEIAQCLEDHYRPQGPSDHVPNNLITICVALADKIDQLAGFWVIDEKPTGSKDPYALRRAALGVLRLILENNLNIDMENKFKSALVRVGVWAEILENKGLYEIAGPIVSPLIRKGKDADSLLEAIRSVGAIGNCEIVGKIPEMMDDLSQFFIDRLKVYLRNQGIDHDLISAVFSLNRSMDFLLIVDQVKTLQGFLNSEDGNILLNSYRRCTNILRIEEKKDKTVYKGFINKDLLELDVEKNLYKAVHNISAIASSHMQKNDFSGAMNAIIQLRSPVDAFFDNVMINDDNPEIRQNRLLMLNQIREVMHKIADFSKIEG